MTCVPACLYFITPTVFHYCLFQKCVQQIAVLTVCVLVVCVGVRTAGRGQGVNRRSVRHTVGSTACVERGSVSATKVGREKTAISVSSPCCEPCIL